MARITQKTLDFLSKNSTVSFAEVREVAQSEGSRQAGMLSQRITYLADIGSIAPMVGLLGTVLGVALGVLLALNIDGVVGMLETMFGFQVLPKGIYFISRLPSDLHWDDVATIGLTACVLAFVATLYPSWRASRVRPAEALRYE